MVRDIAAFAAVAILALTGTGEAQAQSVSGILDTRLVAADGEPAWIDGGFGKGRYGDESGARLAEAAIAWTPRLSDTVTAVVSLESQPDMDRAVDVSEAYVTWKSPPGQAVRLSARAGLYWPQMSLEHDGPLWTVADTITPSAINSWAGEELKVGGAEVSARTTVAGQSFAATVGAFGFGDTAGTLLSFRGWAFHDLKNTAASVMPLPPLSQYMSYRQRPATTSLLELDDRAGVYGRLEWAPTPDLTLHLFRYDNRGDRTSVNTNVEWSWQTRFTEAGAAWTIDDHTRLRTQALSGGTLMGFPDQATGEIWVDVDYASAYVSATHDLGPGALTARLDWFSTTDRTLTVIDNNDEDGWAQLVAYRWDVRPRANIVFEALRIDSDRPSRILAGEAPNQIQTIVQTALRLEL